jgi:hypothetical protein
LGPCPVGAQQLDAYAWRFCYAKAQGAPLKPSTRLRMAKSAILPMGRMKAKGEVRVLEIDQHAVVTWLDRLGDELGVVHFKGRLLLETIKFYVVRTQPVIAILFG